MTTRPTLPFREEAIKHQANHIYGSVFLNIPVSYTFISIGFGVILVATIVWCCLTNYTEHNSVMGYLNASSGMVEVYPLQAGIIHQHYVDTGQYVHRGQRLYVIDTTYDGFSLQDSLEYRQLQARLTTLDHDITLKMHYLQQLKPLLRKHYIALTHYQHERNALRVLKNHRQELLLRRIRYRHSQTKVIRAPISGEITHVEYRTGQMVRPNQALLTLMPEHTKLVAQLYIPVSKSGFVYPQELITLRYDAFPYHHFGVAKARIVSVSRSVSLESDESKPLKMHEPYYKAIAILEQQTISLHGRSKPLHQGMTLTALLPGEHKTIGHWIFDPVFKSWFG